jgi:pseudouridine-5'-phosphate glycosidase
MTAKVKLPKDFIWVLRLVMHVGARDSIAISPYFNGFGYISPRDTCPEDFHGASYVPTQRSNPLFSTRPKTMSTRPTQPLVALESTVLSHGIPRPENEALGRDLEAIVRSEGAVPATIGFIHGTLKVGVSLDEMLLLCREDGVRKVSIKDLAAISAGRQHGATTVASTIWAAHQHGIRVMATGGIGGVHQQADGSVSADVSADLPALAQTPVTVVCSGPKAILHLEATRERLETEGICLVGYRTDRMPAFFCGSSPFHVDERCETAEEIAAIIEARDTMKLRQAILVVNPLPEEYSLPFQDVQDVVSAALSRPEATSLMPNQVTPYLLTAVRDRLGGRVLAANLELLRRNARLAAQIARALTSS